MKKLISLLSFLCVISLSAFVIDQNWILADNYTVRFSNPEVNGSFTKLNATIRFDEKDLAASRIQVSVDVNSVNTGNPEMDKQVTGKDMLNKEQYPQIIFESSSLRKVPVGYEAIGTLKMHGQNKEITIPFTFSDQVFKGNFEVKCSDYGMTGMGHGEADVVKIELSVPVKAG
ncbi:MAG TPA: YceI family protein [Bacteroidia bacterium]|jgi:polyisoprenoid-binding protein YceI|nr:YceI family protein [Bacteroidia bacterium]